ncbi:MAG: Yip1 family protein [Bacteroidales bacterium]
MKLSRLFNRTRFLIAYPALEWEKIKFEKVGLKELLLSYVAPILLFSSLIIFSGRVLNWEDHSITNGILAFISYLSISVFVIYFSALIINQLIPKFGTDKNINHCFKLIIFSSFPALIAAGISSFHPHLTFINYFSLYSVVLFWIGIKPLLNVPAEKLIGFALISLLIIGALLILVSAVIMNLIIYFSIY